MTRFLFIARRALRVVAVAAICGPALERIGGLADWVEGRTLSNFGTFGSQGSLYRPQPIYLQLFQKTLYLNRHIHLSPSPFIANGSAHCCYHLTCGDWLCH